MTEQLRLIRGARILQQLDEVSSVPDLENNIQRGFPETKKRQHATGEVSIRNTQYIPYVGMKTLHVKSNSSSNGHQYNQVIQFNGVTFDSGPTDENATVKASDGTDYHIVPLNLAEHNCKVRCSCLDFYWRFANFNSSDRSLVGKPPPLYQRKTDNRPPANPAQVPGMCKHLLKLVQELQSAGVVSG